MIFIVVIHVKVPDGRVTNRGWSTSRSEFTANGERDLLGPWVGRVVRWGRPFKGRGAP